MKYRCNSCGATYSDTQPSGADYAHACSPEIIKHATFDESGKQLTEETRVQRENIRNENPRADVIEIDGAYFVRTGSTQDEAGPKLTEVKSIILSEGEGRTPVE